MCLSAVFARWDLDRDLSHHPSSTLLIQTQTFISGLIPSSVTLEQVRTALTDWDCFKLPMSTRSIVQEVLETKSVTELLWKTSQEVQEPSNPLPAGWWKATRPRHEIWQLRALFYPAQSRDIKKLQFVCHCFSCFKSILVGQRAESVSYPRKRWLCSLVCSHPYCTP